MVKNEYQLSNFWLGFAFGAIMAGGAAYLLGTKQGRKMLHELLELSEDWEKNLADILEEVSEVVEEKGGEILDEVRKLPAPAKNHTSLQSLLNKMRTLSPQSKKEKRFFVKE